MSAQQPRPKRFFIVRSSPWAGISALLAVPFLATVSPRFIASGFPTVSPYTAQHFMEMAKEDTSISEKISYLRRLIVSFPLDRRSRLAQQHLIYLLAGYNRLDDALREYRHIALRQGIDITLLDYLLKTGQYQEVLRQTNIAVPTVDPLLYVHLMEIRTQAFLAIGEYRHARELVENWLSIFDTPDNEQSHLRDDIESMRNLVHHLSSLENHYGQTGKPLFTATVPDSLRQWKHRKDVPIYFFKLFSSGPVPEEWQEEVSEGFRKNADFFEEMVQKMNSGFDVLSGGLFGLNFKQMTTLYVKEGDLDPLSAGGHLITSRVYAHTIRPLYELAGKAFVVLVDYRPDAGDDAAYVGDGLIHISSKKLKNYVLMHEILHGLGATHKDWGYLQGQGYRFDPTDRGIMTFTQGQIQDFGLEDQNRWVLGWPRITPRRLTKEELSLEVGEDGFICQDFGEPPTMDLPIDNKIQKIPFRTFLSGGLYRTDSQGYNF